MAFAQIGLLEGNQWDSSIAIEGYEAKPGEEHESATATPSAPATSRRWASPCSRAATSTTVTRGTRRPIRTRACRLTYKVAIVNESFAKHYFGDRSPIGRRIGFGGNPGTKTPIEIIGVVKDAKYTGVRDDIPRQLFFAFMENDFAGSAVMYVRTTNAVRTRRSARSARWRVSSTPTSRSTTCARSTTRSISRC